MSEQIRSFGDTAQSLSKNPLGIIALFIVLVYGFASLVVAFNGSLVANERMPIIWFLVIFPVLVLAVFSWLVSQHAGKLYSPSEYKNEENYVAIVASLAAATVKRVRSDSGPTEGDFRDIARLVREIPVQGTSNNRTNKHRILWVDDRPENNVYEKQAFEAVGIVFTLALSTHDALKILDLNSFAAIISDMGREEGPQEGYKLLETIRGRGDRTPFFIYASSDQPEHKIEATRRGAQGSTNDPRELFKLVTGHVLDK
jgi:CheY-like chemotaxis protein